MAHKPETHIERMIRTHTEFRSPTAFGRSINTQVNRAIATAADGGLPTMNVMRNIATGLDVPLMNVIVAFAVDAGVPVRPSSRPKARVLVERLTSLPPAQLEELFEGFLDLILAAALDEEES